MYSPLYEAEQKRLYPHRTNATTPKEVAQVVENLIKNNITTWDKLRHTTYGEMIKHYFIRCNWYIVATGLDLFKAKHHNL